MKHANGGSGEQAVQQREPGRTLADGRRSEELHEHGKSGAFSRPDQPQRARDQPIGGTVGGLSIVVRRISAHGSFRRRYAKMRAPN